MIDKLKVHGKALSEERIREIVREEIQRAHGEEAAEELREVQEEKKAAE